MLESAAYRALSLSAHRVLARIEIELAHHGGKDNGKLPVTYDDFEAYGIDRHAVAPAIRELEALGFIEVTPGSAGTAEFRAPNRFRLTFKDWKRQPPSNEWRRISSAEAKSVARHARKVKNPVWEKVRASAENPHRNHGGDLRTAAHGGDSHITFDISGGGERSAPEGSAVASEPPGMRRD
jgi:DNA-binding transcriptional MocR family regulator